MFNRWIVAAVLVLFFSPSGFAQQPVDPAREQAARRRLEEKNRAARAAREAATRPTTVPAAAANPSSTQPAGAKRSTRIVFVVDASGTMVNDLEDAARDILAAIDLLRPDQCFNVIAASDGRKLSQLDPGMLLPLPENRTKAQEFLKRITAAGTDATLPALQAATKLRPDVVWLISDGDFSGTLEGVITACVALRARVNTAMKYGKGPEEDNLIAIADAAGGSCVRRASTATGADHAGSPSPAVKSVLSE